MTTTKPTQRYKNLTSKGVPVRHLSTIPKRAHPLVKKLFQVMRTEGATLGWLAEQTGIDRTMIGRWRSAYNPILPNIVACFEALDYELKAVPKFHDGLPVRGIYLLVGNRNVPEGAVLLEQTAEDNDSC